METHMLDPRDLYELNLDVADPLRESGDAATTGPALVVALRGYGDAGHVTEISAQHIIATGEPRRVATFDHDRLVDYQAKRPTLTFESARWVDYQPPLIALDLVTDAEGTPYLILHGYEPDRYWDGFIAAVIGLITDFNISLVVNLHGIPMGVPHTRPAGAIVHATRDGLVEDEKIWNGSMQVPATVANLIQYRLGQYERDAIGIAVHVPHYLAQSQYTPAAITGLTKVEALTGLDLAVGELAGAAEEALAEVERQAGKSQDISEMISAMENQYDAFMAAHPEESLLAHVNRIPTADELAAEFEEFLSQQRESGNGDVS
jgi:hypothetical protein